MIQYHNMVDIFYAVKTLRNCKPNMVESLVRESVNTEENMCYKVEHKFEKNSNFHFFIKEYCIFLQEQYRFCYDLVLEYLDCFDGR